MSRGRPLKDGARRSEVKVRLTDEEREMLDFMSATDGKNMSDIIRDSIKMYHNLVKYRASNK